MVGGKKEMGWVSYTWGGMGGEELAGEDEQLAHPYPSSGPAPPLAMNTQPDQQVAVQG